MKFLCWVLWAIPMIWVSMLLLSLLSYAVKMRIEGWWFGGLFLLGAAAAIYTLLLEAIFSRWRNIASPYRLPWITGVALIILPIMLLYGWRWRLP